MSEMSSFYGGRQGAAFVIVKRFDGINIPQPGDGSGVTEYTYTADIYAIDSSTGDFIIVNSEAAGGNVKIANGVYLISKDRDNYKDYAWARHENNGSRINSTSYTFPEVLAEGMVQCFAKGTKSASEVNYGEYVLIDTMLKMRGKNDPDNGKVYRRGMDLNTELAGAEYIGQIVGPQGETPELDIDSYDTIVNITGNKQGIYTPKDNDIIPGSYIDENGDRQFNNDVYYAWVSLRDELDNITGCCIGFKTPTLVQEFVGTSIKPYLNRATDADGKYYNYDLIVEDEDEYVDGKWQHPFYQKWQVKVPHGYHGINSTNLEIVHTKTMPAGYKGDDYEGAKVFWDADLATPLIENGEQVVLSSSYDIVRDEWYDVNTVSAAVFYDGGNRYVSKEDCYMDILRYRETNFDNVEEGEVTYYELGDYNIISKITLSHTGVLTVFYSAEDQGRELQEVLRWIDTDDTDGITIDEDGSVHVYYNTVHAAVGEDVDPYEVLCDEDDTQAHDHSDFDKVFDWITEVTLSQDGKFDVLFNNDTIQNGHYNTTLNWVDYIKIEDDGTIKFYYNSNEDRGLNPGDDDNPDFEFNKMLNYIDDVRLDAIADGSTLEGTGDQKIHITYNTTDSNGDKIEEAIGEPINYVVEALISTPTVDYPTVPYSHLLVYYSDPVYRAKFSHITYPSEKYPGTIWTEWVDLGSVRGAPGGIHVLKDVSDLKELKNASGQWLPPENLGVLPDKEAAGWSCTYTYTDDNGDEITELYFYDYEDRTWYSIGDLNSATTDPKKVIVKSVPDSNKMPISADVNMLATDGFWFASEVAIFAQ